MSSVVSAQQRPPENPAGNSTPDRAGYPYPMQPALQSGVYDLTAVYSQAALARAEERRAYSDLNLAVIRVKREFETSAEFKTAVQEVGQAHDALDNARKPIVEQVGGDPHYKELSQKRDRITELLLEGNLPARDVLDLALRKMEYGSELRRMESEAFNNDSAVQSARTRLVSAQQKVNDMREKFEATLYQNPQWASAKQAYENSRLGSAAAEGAVAGGQATALQAIDSDERRVRYGSYYTNNNSYGDPYYSTSSRFR